MKSNKHKIHTYFMIFEKHSSFTDWLFKENCNNYLEAKKRIVQLQKNADNNIHYSIVYIKEKLLFCNEV